MRHSFISISLIGGASGEHLKAWQAVVKRFRFIAGSDYYLQWLLQVEADGEFEKMPGLKRLPRCSSRNLTALHRTGRFGAGGDGRG